ncbi:hypothetical protein [Methylotetracoccus oryzae]
MNREIVQEAAWDEDRILARGAALFTLAKILWPLPQPTSPDQ